MSRFVLSCRLFSFLIMVLVVPASIKAGSNVEKNESRFLPDYAKFQFAGNIGFVSIGTGYSVFNDHLQADVFYGYVPGSVGGTEIHTLAFRINAIPFHNSVFKNYKLSWIYFGVGINYAPSDKFFVGSFDKYPDDYYHPTALHGVIYAGSKIHRNARFLGSRFRGYDIYVELGTVDTYLKSALKTEEVSYFEILNLSFGLALYF